MKMDYNTQRSKLIMPEYGRHVQKMINYVRNIEDREKRNEQIRAVLTTMGVLNPSLRDINDFKHKLWDHVQIISDFDIDIDSPYPIPTKDTFSTKPNPIPLETNPLKAAHYGRNIQNMLDMVADKPDGETKTNMIRILANYMRQQYLIWNKESVIEETIFKDIYKLSGGRIVVPDDIHLDTTVPREQSTHREVNGYRDQVGAGHRDQNAFRERSKFKSKNIKNKRK